MALNINTNIGALSASVAASAVNKTMETAMERLSSGLRINTASDDAAGMAISSRMEAQIRGLNQAIRNAADGQSLIDTTEGAHNEVTNILQRMRELAVQSANDTNVAGDRANIQAEVTQLIAEIDRIANQTTWNGVAVLDGTFNTKKLQIGAEANQSLSFGVESTKSSALGAYKFNSTATLTAGATNTVQAAANTISGYAGTATWNSGAGDSAQTTAAAVNSRTASTGVSATAFTQVKLSGLSHDSTVGLTINGTAISSVNVTTGNLINLKTAINEISGSTGVTASMEGDSTIILTALDGRDIKFTSATLSGNTNAATLDTQVLLANGTYTTAAAGTQVKAAVASVVATGYVALDSTKSFQVVGAANAGINPGATSSGSLSSVASVNVSTVSGAASAISIISTAINKINQSRGDLGAISNRLDNTISNLTNISTNVSSSQSRIQDADFAAESTNLAKSQILQQAATAMLAQANAAKQGVLQLLQG